MALKLENEFVVAAPVEPTWATLLDLARVARCLPGATIEPGEEEGTYDGKMRVKLGPVTMDYRGVARIEQVDEAARVAIFNVQGKELRGQGTATARIRNTLAETDGGTRVLVETELSVTGRPAQFGRGIMQDVAASMLDDFSRCLSEMMGGGEEPPAAGAAAEPGPGGGEQSPRGSLDLTSAVGGVLRERLVRLTGLAALGRLLSKLRRHDAAEG